MDGINSIFHFSFNKYHKIVHFSFLVAAICPKNLATVRKMVLPDSGCSSLRPPWLVRYYDWLCLFELLFLPFLSFLWWVFLVSPLLYDVWLKRTVKCVWCFYSDTLNVSVESCNR